ncbi:MAG: hypothetical protein MZV63_69075 [Marinilabiliales bacterium]|nr:hypothetical protein [Marinilabiliales bacterium]
MTAPGTMSGGSITGIILFPAEWKKIRIKKRHVEFAWGPTEDREPERFDRIEFTVASFVGGKGTLWIDDLRFEPLPPEKHEWPGTGNISIIICKEAFTGIDG